MRAKIVLSFSFMIAILISTLLSTASAYSPNISDDNVLISESKLKDGYITRERMIEIAEGYKNYKWYPTKDNIFHGTECGKPVDTPDRDTYTDWPEWKGWKASQENIGVPYQWGGFSSIPGFNFVNPENFEDQYRGKSGIIHYAGDIAIVDYECPRACGVDCSGFVSRCWNLSEHQSTRSLATREFSWPIKFDQLRFGDILDSPGVHVMLFKEFVNPEKTRIRVYEASSIDWKVNEREYEVERISEDRYSVVIGGIEYKLFTYNPIKWGLMWLEEHQNPYDGSWSDNVGITSLATLAFLNAGYDETYPTVKKAIQYILAHQNPDGSFGWGTYETSTAIWALVATHNPDYHDEISAAKDWLIKAQSDEEDGTPPDDPCYGGWRYGISSHDGDLSNTQFALMALDAAYTELGLKKPDPNDPNGWVFKAIKFISRCQNRPASNDQPWAHDATQPSYNDGGFIYHPRGWSLAGGTKSYGSMTVAGIWSLRLCGVDVNDGRIQDALKWLAKNEDGSFDDNPGHPYEQPHCFLYYYYLTFAKALTMCFLQKLGEVDWYTALSSKLIDIENNDGHWVNAPAAHGQEDIPDLATSYAILTLQVRQIPAEIKSLSWLTIILRSNADLHVYDPFGRHVGKNYETGEIEIQIPNATYIYNEFQNITIPELESGNYRIVLVGTGTGSYTLNVTGGVGNTTVSKYSYTGSITKGEVHDSVVDVAMITWLTIYVEEPIPVEAMVQSSTGTGNVSFISDAGTIENLVAISESELPAEGKPALSFPHGLFSFNITGLTVGQTVNITITFPSNIPVTAQYWKYHTPEGWYQIPIRSNDGDNIIIIQLTDGGMGDDDGIANGVIVDAGGPGIPKPPVGGKIVLVNINDLLAPWIKALAMIATAIVAIVSIITFTQRRYFNLK